VSYLAHEAEPFSIIGLSSGESNQTKTRAHFKVMVRVSQLDYRSSFVVGVVGDFSVPSCLKLSSFEAID
jgi:hypothetical protein